MACENCFNGCADITSDKCVKYTGVPIPGLGINTGDSLFVIEQQITAKVLTLMNGTGIIPIIDPDDICDVVQELIDQVNCCLPLNLNDIISVFLQAICILNDKNEGLKTRIVNLETAVNALNSLYTIPANCIVVAPGSEDDTHAVLQATISYLCALSVELHGNYVRIDDIDSYIANYLSGAGTGLRNAKMIPFIAYPYFGPITDFSITGAGSGVWDRVFLCNGQNGTQDLRGRTLVGATTMGTTPFNSAVDPSINGNPTYNATTEQGANTVTLNPSQVPNHGHAASVVLPPHTHDSTFKQGVSVNGAGEDLRSAASTTGATITLTSLPNLSVTVPVTVVDTSGGGNAHNNIQPSRGVNYIMYIP